MKIKVIALALAILAFFFFVGSPFQQAANAIVLVDDAFLAVVIAALAAFGIVFTSTGGFSTIQGFINDIINQYAVANNTTVGNLLYGIQTGSNNLGEILLNNRYVVFLQGLATFIKASYNLTDNERKQLVSSSSSVGAVMLYDLPVSFSHIRGTNNYRFEMYVGEGAFMFLEQDGNFIKPYFVSNFEGVMIQRFYIDSNGLVSQPTTLPLTEHVDGKVLYGVFGGLSLNETNYGLEDASVYPNGTYVNLLNSEFQVIEGSSYDLYVTTGTMELPFDSPDYDTGDGAMLDVLAAWGMTYDTITYRVIPGTYEDATITYDTEEAVQEQVTDTPQTNISEDAGDYTVPGLQSVFPFCIPFDIYNFFNCLAADPVAPSFEWRFYVPGICDETIDLDLAQFDTVAQIVRTMELLAFIVGLAFVTRDKMIKG